MAGVLDIGEVARIAGDAIDRIFYKEITGSTNDDVLAMAGQWGRAVVVADRQEAGRGRRNAKWSGEPGETICFSMAIERPTGGVPVSLIAGVACAEAIARSGCNVMLKWPNDIYYGDRKVGGILVEGQGDTYVVGIGLNVAVAEFPSEIAEIATDLRSAGCAWTAEQVLGECLHELGQWLDGGTESEAVEILRRRCWLSGKTVRLTTAGQEIEGHVTGVGDLGELLLWTGRSTRVITSADEVRVV